VVTASAGKRRKMNVPLSFRINACEYVCVLSCL